MSQDPQISLLYSVLDFTQNPTVLEKIASQNSGIEEILIQSLVLILFLLPFVLLYYVRKTVSARFLFVFLLPLPAILGFFQFQNFQLLENINRDTLLELRFDLEKEFQQITRSRINIDDIFMAKISKTLEEVKTKINLFASSGYDFKSDHSNFAQYAKCEPSRAHSKEYKPIRPFDSYLSELQRTQGINLMLINDTTFFASDIFVCNSFHGLGGEIQKIVRLEIMPGLELKGESMVDLLATANSLTRIVDNSRLMFKYLNNPSSLHDDNPAKFREEGFTRQKAFWSYLLQDKPEYMAWFVMGSVDESLVYQQLEREISKLSEASYLDYKPHFFVPNYKKILPFHQSDLQFSDDLFDPVKARSYHFIAYEKEDQPYLGILRSFEMLKDSYMLLEVPASAWTAKAKWQKRILLLSFAFLLLTIGSLAFFFSKAITNPVFAITEKMKRIARGEFEPPLPVRTSDEIGSLSQYLNELSQSLKEKSLVQSFLSSMAKDALKNQNKKPLREDMIILFLGWNNLEQFQFQTQKDYPRYLQRIIKELTHLLGKHGGSLDKFTGQSFLLVLPYKNISSLQTLLGELEKLLHEILFDFARDNLPHCSFTLGVSYGPLVVGAIGAQGRQDFTVIGNTVNVAARLDKLARDSLDDRLFQVAVLGELEQYLPESWGTYLEKNVQVKGKVEGLDVYLLA